jgi:hypothetical protein
MGRMFLYGGAALGGLLGGYLPVVLVHASELGLASILGGTTGGFLGLWVGFKVYQALDL